MVGFCIKTYETKKEKWTQTVYSLPKKRGTHNALAFEADYERKCIRLWREIISYQLVRKEAV